MKPRISILCPTRGRPGEVFELLATLQSTVDGPVEVIFYRDEDDPYDYREDAFSGNIRWLRGPRIMLSECWNRCADVAQANIMMHCGDDIRFRTPGWDSEVLEAFSKFPDGIVLVYGRDGIQDAGVATHGFYHRRAVEAVGYFVPPYFASDYNDLWWTEVYREIGRLSYLADIYTEHMHPAVGKAELDQTHQERLARHRNEDCDAIWKRTAPQRAEDVQKLRAAIEALT